MKIQELTLLTNNLSETKEFYLHKIGFEIMEETKTKVAFNVGNSKLIFEQTYIDKNPKYHFALNIPSNKIDEAKNWALQRVNLISMDNSFIANFENWNAKAIYFFDNNKNIVELISRTDLNNESEIPFSEKAILSINEIGLVIDKPLKTADEIIQKFKTSYFSKGPKREDFVAVGNDEGLFVISNPNRNWYPTNESAEKWSVKAKFKIAENEYELEFN